MDSHRLGQTLPLHIASSSLSKPRQWIMGQSAFERRMPHHDGIAALWETMWKLPCTKAAYPFHDGAYEDFEPVFQHLIADHVNDGTSNEFTQAFFPTAQRLEVEADEAVRRGDETRARSLYLRATCILRIARFPYITGYPRINDGVKWKAWEWQKAVYTKAGRRWTVPLTEVAIPHVFGEGADGDSIPVYVRVPESQVQDQVQVQGRKETKQFPAVLLLTGLDGYRPDFTGLCDELLSRGWATIVAEIPGTADCPADSADPESPDRLWSSVLDWMESDRRFDMGRILCWGLSTGGYYAIRIAHTHKHRLLGAIAQGAGCHYFYDRDWIDKADGHEYPFQLSPAFAMKHGFETVQDYKEGVQKKFSLLELGIIQKPSTKLLLLNGTLDGLMPIEDSMILFEYGSPKEARFFPDALHMGGPMAVSAAYQWMEEVMASK
ncbi:Alpha/Beta hydrolase protein [Dactylonectria estremocensis]|uniref:Alpha/Beta hydrolase protein n=1 Tax=Dactylonectria estremocensis TaxID=1079267 RepID=A0A9P9FDF0_9HYPO|nr:Alpha/Beta hydrolase protein [Dactylonectria estremocensis]